MKKRLRSPIKYFGGKGLLVSKLLQYIPSHKLYVEVFGGGASLLFAKEPTGAEVYNDINGDLVNLFRVIRDNFDEFYKLVCLTPYSREEYYYCRDNYKNEQDKVKRAYMFFIVARQTFGGTMHSWGYTIASTNKNMCAEVSKYLSTIEMLPEIHSRIMRVQIENDDFRKIIPRYDTPETFFYLDPPYLPETRKSGKYKFEMTYEDHQGLIDLLLQIKGKAMLSGYPNELYKILENNGWIRKDFQTSCHAAGKTRYTKILGKGSATKMQPRTECIWINYSIDKLLIL